MKQILKQSRMKQIAAGILSMILGILAFQFSGMHVMEVQAAQSRTGNFNRNYSLGSNGAENLAAVAQAQVGRQLGYTENWCADFVSDCADLAGLSTQIPRNANVTQLYNAVIRAGGTEVSAPQRGDLIFYKCNCMTRPLLHVGIMLDNTYSAEGNLGSLTNPVQRCDGYYFCHGAGGNVTHSVQNGQVKRVYVRPQFNGGGNGGGQITVYFSPYNTKYSVGTTNAVLSRTITVTNASIRDISEVGIFLYDANNNRIASKGEKPIPVGNQINAWYDVNKELGKTLNPGTTYKYKFYAVINNIRYEENAYMSFTTQNQQASVTFSSYAQKYSVGRTNATVSRTIKVSNASIRDVSKVGIVLYDANSRVLASKQEVPVPVGNQINAWYDINRELGVTLRRNTVYKYQFTAVVGGKTYYSSMMKFTTSR